MEAQIMKFEAPFDYIYCGGEIAMHIGTYIVGEAKISKQGEYELETHSHPIVAYPHTPGGVVWNKAELTDCVVLCNDNDKRIDARLFFMLVLQLMKEQEEEEGIADSLDEDEDDDMPIIGDEIDEAWALKYLLSLYGIGFKPQDGVEEVTIEIRKNDIGYSVQALNREVVGFNIIEGTLDDVVTGLREQQQEWESLYAGAVKIKFTPLSDIEKSVTDRL